MSFKISSDSTCDLLPSYLEENEVFLSRLTIILGATEYTDCVDIDTQKALAYVEETGQLPKTAAYTVEQYIEDFKNLTKDGSELIHFSISSKSSSSHDHALLASKEVKGVYVVDSKHLSTGQGLQIVKAVEMRKEGKSAKEVYDYMTANTSLVQTSFVVDRLDFLHKGGRCSLLQLLGAKMLKIHPQISMKDGALSIKKKYSGNMIRSVNQYVLDLANEYTNYDKKLCFITHCEADRAIVDAVRAKVEELFEFEEIIETKAGTTVGVHCGKNTIGVLFWTL